MFLVWDEMGWQDCEVGEPIDRRDAPVTMDVTGRLQPWMSGQKTEKRLGVVMAGRRRAAIDARASAKSDASQAERWLLSEKDQKEAGRRVSSSAVAKWQ
jgi:hypothetical protein